MPTKTTIYHIALDADIATYKTCGEYRCASLESEGFIHCCNHNQLAGVVSRYYHGVDNVQLMTLDCDKLSSPPVLENTVGGTELFAHIYGTINSDAVTSIVPFGLSSTARQRYISAPL